MSDLKYNDWRAENGLRNYPFADDATLIGETLTLPKSLFLDARLYPIGGTANMFLNRVTKSGSTVTFGIQSEGAGELASGSYLTSDVPETGEVPLADAYGRPAGLLLSTPAALGGFGGIAEGTYEFLVSQTPFAAAAVIAQPDPCLRGFILPDESVLSGDVWLVGEDGVVLRIDDDGSLRVDIVGDPFAARKLCADQAGVDSGADALQPYCPIKTINGIAPDDRGNFQLLPGNNQTLASLLRINPGETGNNQIAEHMGGAGALRVATLIIKTLGDRRMQGSS